MDPKMRREVWTGLDQPSAPTRKTFTTYHGVERVGVSECGNYLLLHFRKGECRIQPTVFVEHSTCTVYVEGGGRVRVES